MGVFGQRGHDRLAAIDLQCVVTRRHVVVFQKTICIGRALEHDATVQLDLVGPAANQHAIGHEHH